jgi:hypothetical protein
MTPPEQQRCSRSVTAATWTAERTRPRVELQDGTVRLAEIHWYEASGVGRPEFKLKGYLDCSTPRRQACLHAR